MKARMILLTMTILLAVCCLFDLQTGQTDDAPARKGVEVALRTVYLAETVGNAHRITLAGELGGKGKMTLDGNTCTITQFGDPGVCTEAFFPPIDVKFAQLRLADPTGQGRRIFRIEGKLAPKSYTYYLIVPRRRSGAHRLVVDMGDDKRRTISLEHVVKVETPVGKPELCKNAKYSAKQADGKVTIVAKGENPTSGYKVAFEQLPIDIFPPQHRLVCVKPGGIVLQVITPFEVTTSFKSKAAIKQIIVHDANGQHKVPVQQPK